MPEKEAQGRRKDTGRSKKEENPREKKKGKRGKVEDLGSENRYANRGTGQDLLAAQNPKENSYPNCNIT